MKKKKNRNKGIKTTLYHSFTTRPLPERFQIYCVFVSFIFFIFVFLLQYFKPNFQDKVSKNVFEALFTKSKTVFHQENFGNSDYSSYKSLGKVCAHTMLVVNMQSKCL